MLFFFLFLVLIFVGYRYSNDAELRKSLALDAEVQNEFIRQREHLEILLSKEQSNKGSKLIFIFISSINNNLLLFTL